MNYEIVSIKKLRPLERVFPTHLKNLEEMINKDGFLLKAIIADKKTGAIMDGSHRYVYLLKNGYKEAPVYWSNYDDEDVRVGTNLSHRFLVECGSGISKEECRRRALDVDLFSPRTTRHFFTFRKSDISLPLNQLRRGGPVDVSHLVVDVDISEEIEHNKRYLTEISEETEIIIQYLEEVSQTKRYLLNQIELMNSVRQVAFFPGKFHPPHLGHLKTILDLSKKYSKLIIGVSEHAPDRPITNVDIIIDTLKDLFRNLDNIEIKKIKGTLIKKKSIVDLPEFDVLLSGNKDVLDWATKMKIKNKYVSRAEGYLFSGTEIRDELRNS